jgi:hypothetical protein
MPQKNDKDETRRFAGKRKVATQRTQRPERRGHREMKKALEPIPPWGRFLVEAPEARHSLAQPVRAGLKGGRMASTGGAPPNQLVPRKRAPKARHTLAQPVRAGLKGGRMASTGGAARWSRTGRKNKTPRPKSGRTFLQHGFYKDRAALVKENVSNGAE